jgi:membrane associated rhomboid family serine protease
MDTALAGAPPPMLTVFTSMFVHGGLLHVGGNMLYLWIFGKAVEDSMGHGRFLGFYLVCGVVAAGAQYLQEPASALPMVGASGAVAGTLGAYLLLHPNARIWTVVVFGYFVRTVPVPAMVVLLLVHMTQVFLHGAYKYPRELTWLVGVVLFVLTMGMFFSGARLIGVFRRSPSRVAAGERRATRAATPRRASRCGIRQVPAGPIIERTGPGDGRARSDQVRNLRVARADRGHVHLRERAPSDARDRRPPEGDGEAAHGAIG